jgi:HD-GYP domain-containing protein (c-di-GMP phosphodiesterase class II)
LFAEAATPYDEAARDVAIHHHERWDGTGYPGVVEPGVLGSLPAEFDANPPSTPLRGEQIPLFARIVAVADVYDALTSQRSYKEAWTREQVTEFLRRESGKHFDPELVQIALELQGYFESVRARYASGH